MNITKKKSIHLATALACLLGTIAILSLWNKSDFCRGWSEHYSARAAKTQDLLTDAIDQNRLADAEKLDSTVRVELIIAEKYRRVSMNPFRAYPEKPLVTARELDEFTSSQRETGSVKKS